MLTHLMSLDDTYLCGLGLLFFAVSCFECELVWEGCLSLFHVEVVAMSVSSLECGWAAWSCHMSSAALGRLPEQQCSCPAAHGQQNKMVT